MNRSAFEHRARRSMLVIGAVSVLAIIGTGVIERDGWLPELLAIIVVIPLLFVSWKIGIWLTRKIFKFGDMGHG